MEILSPGDERLPVGPLRFAPAEHGGRRAIDAFAGNDRLAAVFVPAGGPGSAHTVVVTDGARFGRLQAGELIHTLILRGPEPVLIDSRSALVRHTARRMGFTGGLRGPLTAPLTHQLTADDARQPLAEQIAAAVASLTNLPVVPHEGRQGRRLTAGIGSRSRSQLNLIVDPGPGRAAFTVTAAAAPDLMVESVALAVETLVAVRRWFGPAADHLRHLSFDPTDRLASRLRWAGMANTQVFVIHLNSAYAYADASTDWVHDRNRSLPAEDRAPRPPPDYQFLGRVTAHEAWHQIEAAFTTRRRADALEFRRRLGHVLGVETLEQAVKGAHRNAPAEWRAGYEQLRDEVSAYATTNPVEATAEMFELWWSGSPAGNDVVAGFGDLVSEYFAVAPR